jgi:hypothetical protein
LSCRLWEVSSAYRLFQLTIPALLGAPAFAMLRRRLIRADNPALVCAPLAVETVKLPAGMRGPP